MQSGPYGTFCRPSKTTESPFKLLPLVAFAVPFIWLYLLEPTRLRMWKGRTFQLFFIWLIGLELILDWETIKATKLNKLVSPRTFAFSFASVLPTLYVAASYYGGLNVAITNWATQSQHSVGRLNAPLHRIPGFCRYSFS